MAIDFESEYGVNAGYVEELYNGWLESPGGVDESWAKIFARLDPAGAAAAAERLATKAAASKPKPKAASSAASMDGDEDAEYEKLKGVGRLIVKNMVASLDVPTATSVRVLPVKLLDENRRLINEHMAVRSLGKSSYTHIIAFAMIRALGEMPRVQSSFEENDSGIWRRVPKNVNFGLAIDVPGAGGARQLVVPKIAAAETLNFNEFYSAYQGVVARGRDGELTSEDYADCTVTLTNPGGFGTTMSVPRLMAGQGLILAVGSIGVPPEMRGMAPSTLAANAIGPVMTITATYDHRVIQGAESGLLLRRVEQLLSGDDGFYDQIFRDLRIPWSPVRISSDESQAMRHGSEQEQLNQRARVWQLVNAYRSRGCRLADLDPLEYTPDPIESLDPATYGFTVWDLDRMFSAGDLSTEPMISLRDILVQMRRAYCRRWTVEYMHIVSHSRKMWMRAQVEDSSKAANIDQEDRIRILTMLSRAENFERFLGATYVGNKRFSLEGGDSMIPALAALLDRAAEGGVERVVIGMAHRGRLNVLANIMGKSRAQIFSEFEGVLLPLSQEGSGDVKYHLGQQGTYTTYRGKKVEVVLCANPSHLEAVDPVVCGMTRAYQDAIEDTDRTRVLAVQIHGDAAFSGQGVVPETLNLSQLAGYTNGGTVHLVVNNQIGFTASPKDTRSTYYCTDVAKAVQAPILHANGDNPEAVVRASLLAVDYQREFKGDVVIDMVCYRRWGHNEGDEPAYTQPTLYSKINSHPTVPESYKGLLIRRGMLTEDEAAAIFEETSAELSIALKEFRGQAKAEQLLPEDEILDVTLDDPADYAEQPSPVTGVDCEQLVTKIDELNVMPAGHVTHPNLLRQLRRRERMVRGELDLDWGCAEAMAFATLVADGLPIRLSGQDSGRGTFSHRHSVIRHQEDDSDHVPLAVMAEQAGNGGSFEVYDSALSEEAVVGFEYGYSLARPGTMVIWEAQFGDFVNGAQIQIDQFVTSGATKWKQNVGLTMLLPHGFDGMGPEHSSAWPVRFFGLANAGNMTICNVSTAAQYFHMLRRQGLSIQAGETCPLIVFTPKSLLRDKRAASPVEDLAAERFQEILVAGDMVKAKRVILCTGKVRHDLLDAYRTLDNADDYLVVSLEQLYPLPLFALREFLEELPDADWVWCQEEPRNMGPWGFVLQRFSDQGRSIRYVGRPDASSPATGSYRRHSAEQEYLVRAAFA